MICFRALDRLIYPLHPLFLHGLAPRRERQHLLGIRELEAQFAGVEETAEDELNDAMDLRQAHTKTEKSEHKLIRTMHTAHRRTIS